MVKIDFIDLSFVLTQYAQYASLVLFLFGAVLTFKSESSVLRLAGVLSIIASALIIILRVLSANGIIIL